MKNLNLTRLKIIYMINFISMTYFSFERLRDRRNIVSFIYFGISTQPFFRFLKFFLKIVLFSFNIYHAGALLGIEETILRSFKMEYINHVYHN